MDRKPTNAAAVEASRIFRNAEAFTEAANGYFEHADACGELYGEAGLALWLSEHNAKKRVVSTRLLHEWLDGTYCADLRPAVEIAYLRMQHQMESDPRYQEKGGMTSVRIYLQKQKFFGGYTDKTEEKKETTVRIVHGRTMDEEDFK